MLRSDCWQTLLEQALFETYVYNRVVKLSTGEWHKLSYSISEPIPEDIEPRDAATSILFEKMNEEVDALLAKKHRPS